MNRFQGFVIVRHHHNRPCGHDFPRVGVYYALLHGHRLVADLRRPHANLDVIVVVDGRLVGNVNVGDDNADLHESLVAARKPKLNQIADARLLEVGQVFGVVDVSLRVQISVADFGWVKEFIVGHAGIIVGESVVG